MAEESAPQQKTTRTSVCGFTTLFAVLVASLLLAVGLAIFDITYKEVIFSTIARDSNFAIYAADSGIECSLFWDLKYTGSANYHSGGVFATSSGSSPPASGSGIFCNGADLSSLWTYPSYQAPLQNPSASAATTTFTLTFAPQPYCVTVTVAKSGTPVSTTVVARGYNTCISGAPTRIERALQINY